MLSMLMEPFILNRAETSVLKLLLILLICIGASSCNERSKLRKTMTDFMGSVIVIPDDLECISNRSIENISIEDLKPARFIVYYDSLGCSSCRISHLADIYPLLDLADSSDFSVVTIFSPRQEELEDVRVKLMVADYDFPVYVDVNGTFGKLNRCIPTDVRFHEFLLDEMGKPLFVGNPTSNEQLSDLFRVALREQNNNN